MIVSSYGELASYLERSKRGECEDQLTCCTFPSRRLPPTLVESFEVVWRVSSILCCNTTSDPGRRDENTAHHAAYGEQQSTPLPSYTLHPPCFQGLWGLSPPLRHSSSTTCGPGACQYPSTVLKRHLVRESEERGR